MVISERPKRAKSVSAETEISAKLTENSAEISAEILPKITWKWGLIIGGKIINSGLTFISSNTITFWHHKKEILF